MSWSGIGHPVLTCGIRVTFEPCRDCILVGDGGRSVHDGWPKARGVVSLDFF